MTEEPITNQGNLIQKCYCFHLKEKMLH